MDVIQQIESLEERLRKAMLNSDVAELDSLLSSDLIFTNHLGMVITKSMDLDAHKDKLFTFQSLVLSESSIMPLDGVAVVTAKVDISGCYNGEKTSGVFRFTRVWSSQSGKWQVIAGHSCCCTDEG